MGLLLEPISCSSDDQDALECITNMYCEPKVAKKTVNDVIQETSTCPLLDGKDLKLEWQGSKAMINGCYKKNSLLKTFVGRLFLNTRAPILILPS